VSSLDWPIARAPQKIAGDQVHVWAWPLDTTLSCAGISADVALLDDEERGRFHRFRFEPDRIRFAIAHANRRRVLGAYLDRDPESLCFRSGLFGKPELVGTSPDRTLYFNLSHCRTTALLALSRSTEVGVDVEDIKPMEYEVAERHFSPVELAALASLEGPQWLRGFYNCWTRKEAILKAEGVGLKLPLDSFDVTLTPGAPAKLLQVRPPAVFRKPWTLHNLSNVYETAAALAAASSNAEICCFCV
jgi:4'-phosphopantetheinyl transferase